MVEQFSDDEKLRCLEREIALRRKVYPGLISKGNMASKTAFRKSPLWRPSPPTTAPRWSGISALAEQRIAADLDLGLGRSAQS